MMKCAVVRRGEPTSTNARAFRCHNSPRAECTSARSAMASTPTTPERRCRPSSTFPPMTISPQVTRLDRVLDLVTSHEAQFRDQELRSVDVSRRVAALEVALGAGRGDGAEDERDVRSELEAAREAVRHLHLENRALRADVQGAFERARAETDEKIAAMKAGFKSVLQDVVDRVASQLDAARKSEFERAGRYASAAELAALSERVASHESARDASHADALRRIDDLSTDRDKQKRRMAKLIAHYNDVIAEPDGATRRIDGSEPTPHSRESRTDAAVETLARRLDEQAAETTALRERFRNLSAELDAARRENERLARVSDTVSDTVRHAHARAHGTRGRRGRDPRARDGRRDGRRARERVEPRSEFGELGVFFGGTSRFRRVRERRGRRRARVRGGGAGTIERGGGGANARGGARGGGFRPLLGEDEAARRRRGGGRAAG